jgi:hypothetical protein
MTQPIQESVQRSVGSEPPSVDEDSVRLGLAMRPVLAALLRESGELPLLDYAAGFFARGGPPVSPVALAAVERTAGRLFGARAGAEVASQLRWQPAINTAEHLAPMFHPRRFQSNLLGAYGAAEQGAACMPVLACSNISLSNSSHPRGVFWNQQPLQLIPRNPHGTVYAWPAVERQVFLDLPVAARVAAAMAYLTAAVPQLAALPVGEPRNRVRKRLAAALKELSGNPAKRLPSTELPEEVQALLRATLPGARAAGAAEETEVRTCLVEALPPELFAETRYIHQVCRLNGALWERAMGGHLPRLIYLPMEEISTALLRHALHDPYDPFRVMLLDADARALAMDLFADLPYAWSESGGTHFFWQLGPRGRRFPLRHDGAALCGQGCRIELRETSLLDALDAVAIVPVTLLQVLLLVHHGFRCLGGFNQIQFLPAIRRQMHEFCRQIGRTAVADERYGAALSSDFLAGPLFWWRGDPEAPASLDTFLRQPERSREEAAGAVRRLSLRSATLLGLPDLIQLL